VTTAALLLAVLVWIAAGVVTLLKRKWGSLVVGLAFTPVWIVSALRLARPDSWWARRFYSDERRERARRREGNGRYRGLVIAALTLSVILVALLLGFVKLYRIPAASMEQALRPGRPRLRPRRQPRLLMRRPCLGHAPARGRDRHRRRTLLATEPDRPPLTGWTARTRNPPAGD
jgi:hypothetical protein